MTAATLVDHTLVCCTVCSVLITSLSHTQLTFHSSDHQLLSHAANRLHAHIVPSHTPARAHSTSCNCDVGYRVAGGPCGTPLTCNLRATALLTHCDACLTFSFLAFPCGAVRRAVQAEHQTTHTHSNTCLCVTLLASTTGEGQSSQARWWHR